MSSSAAATTSSGTATTSPSYTFSAEAAPFIPSFMRTAAVPAPALPPPPPPASVTESVTENDEELEGSMGDEDGSQDNYRQHFSKMWMLCLEQMQGHEVGMLMDMMPPDIQDLYSDKLSDEYLHHDHEHKDKGVHALSAAQKMVKELSPEQLVHIEEFLVETDALNPAVRRRRDSAHLHHEGRGDRADDHDSEPDGDYNDDDDDEQLFLNDDKGMGQEEEEWLLEQMMAAAGHTVENATATTTAMTATEKKNKKKK